MVIAPPNSNGLLIDLLYFPCVVGDFPYQWLTLPAIPAGISSIGAPFVANPYETLPKKSSILL
jgi:hypothetical protein